MVLYTFQSTSWKWDTITEEAKLNMVAFRKYILEVFNLQQEKYLLG